MAYDAENFTATALPPLNGCRANVVALRERIASLPPHRFNMNAWIQHRNQGSVTCGGPEDLLHSCNTVGCIGGWAAGMMFSAGLIKESNDQGCVAAWLGLSNQQERDLFMPAGYEESPVYTQAAAVCVLDHYLATGEVDWSVA